METEFWRSRWQQQEIGFHQQSVHALLQEQWRRLGLKRGTKVFVPLCGKTLDMAWLADEGHSVIGAELSEIAIVQFFAERGLTPTVRTCEGFVVSEAGPYELWCGDIFDLPNSAVAGIAGVYDRAALIAFPLSMQECYATKLKSLLPDAAPILLIALDYDQSQMQGPPFATSRAQVRRLFTDRYEVDELVSRSVLEETPRFKDRGLTALEECAFLLRQT
jgi:thiopurine S-methyltransferase